MFIKNLFFIFHVQYFLVQIAVFCAHDLTFIIINAFVNILAEYLNGLSVILEGFDSS